MPGWNKLGFKFTQRRRKSLSPVCRAVYAKVTGCHTWEAALEPCAAPFKCSWPTEPFAFMDRLEIWGTPFVGVTELLGQVAGSTQSRNP